MNCVIYELHLNKTVTRNSVYLKSNNQQVAKAQPGSENPAWPWPSATLCASHRPHPGVLDTLASTSPNLHVSEFMRTRGAHDKEKVKKCYICHGEILC